MHGCHWWSIGGRKSKNICCVLIDQNQILHLLYGITWIDMYLKMINYLGYWSERFSWHSQHIFWRSAVLLSFIPQIYSFRWRQITFELYLMITDLSAGCSKLYVVVLHVYDWQFWNSIPVVGTGECLSTPSGIPNQSAF